MAARDKRIQTALGLFVPRGLARSLQIAGAIIRTFDTRDFSKAREIYILKSVSYKNEVGLC